MSDKAETVTCTDCDGIGHLLIHPHADCPTCSGTGVRTTGEVDPTRRTCGECGTEIDVRFGDCAVFGVHTLLFVQSDSGFDSGATVTDERDATIAALTTERDVLRLEVQRLKDLNFESQDLYAAIEAERDELRDNTVPGLEEERDGLRAAIGLREYQAKEDRTEASARAESYLRVIEAKDAEIAAMAEGWKASLRTGVAMAEAGLGFRHVSHGLNSPVAREEADRG